MPGPRNRPRKPKRKKRKGDSSVKRVESPKPEPSTPIVTQPPSTANITTTTTTTEETLEVKTKDDSEYRTYLRPSASGPRLSGIQEFMSSPFAEPPTLSDVHCAYFASENILNALTYYLPFELALTVWYNKTRAYSRICAACQRFYRLGEKLPSLIPTKPEVEALYDGPQREREKWISGLCSFMCFGITLVNTPGGLDAWGRLEHEIDQQTLWLINNSPSTVDDQGLGRLFKLTRKPDLGIQSLQISFQTAPTSTST